MCNNIFKRSNMLIENISYYWKTWSGWLKERLKKKKIRTHRHPSVLFFMFTRFEEMSQVWPWSYDLTELFWLRKIKMATKCKIAPLTFFVCLVMIHLGYDFFKDRWKLTEGFFLRCWAFWVVLCDVQGGGGRGGGGRGGFQHGCQAGECFAEDMWHPFCS